MKLVTAAEMAEIDRRAIEELGIPGIVLMENAGLQVVQVMERHFGPVAGKKICIVCGKGNNGGDGFVVARHLFNRGADVRVFLLAELEDLKGSAKTNMEIAKSMDLPIQIITNGKRLDELKHVSLHSSFIVDAMFGTGLKSIPRSFYLDVINLLNDSQKPIVAVDVPTGLCASTGNLLGENCIHARLTVTFALPKFGLVCSPYRKYVGTLEVVDISIPSLLTDIPEIEVNVLEAAQIKTYFRPRPLSAQKRHFGHVLVIAGSPGKTGAGVMSAEAVLRSGAGLATLVVPESLHHVVEMKTTEVMTVGLPETSAHTLSPKGRDQILSLARHKKAVAIGPGLHTHPETAVLVQELITNLNSPIVVDADGINNLPLATLHYCKAPLIITPHPGEMARLLKVPVEDIQASRLEAVRETAKACNTFVVLKGDRTLISTPEGEVFVNPTGNPGMASAGTGDVVTGIISGFLAQGFSPVAACQAGVFLHGLAGDLACREKGEQGLIATDIIDYLPNAILSLLDN